MSDATLIHSHDNNDARTNNNAPDPAHSGAVKLTRDMIRASQSKPRTDTVWIEEWSTFATIRVMTGKERDAYEADITGTRVRAGDNSRVLNLTNIRARLVARCLIDADTFEPLYDWRKPGDLDELGATDAAILDKIFTAASQLNGITERDIDQLTKNSRAEANDVSGSN